MSEEGREGVCGALSDGEGEREDPMVLIGPMGEHQLGGLDR